MKKERAKRGGESEMEPVEVFCRVRPPNPPGSEVRSPQGRRGCGSGRIEVCAEVVSDVALRLIPPESIVAKNPMAKPTENQFTGVLDEGVGQGEVFERVSSGLVADLVSGKNGLLFAYGITGSGKTFTMTGNPDHVGVLPRTLDVLFNSIAEFLANRCVRPSLPSYRGESAPVQVFTPDGYNQFNVRTEGAAALARQDLDRRNKGIAKPPRTPGLTFNVRTEGAAALARQDLDRRNKGIAKPPRTPGLTFNVRTEGAAALARQELDRRNKGIAKPPRTPGLTFNVRTEGAAALARQELDRRNKGIAKPPRTPGRKKLGSEDWELLPREAETGRIRDVDEDNGYAVFVSYVEVYNNYIYDLLDPNAGVDGKPLTSKGLREDRGRNTYVNDVTEVEVTSTDEAFQQFIKGQRNRRVAQTVLNSESSRSHSVFNIRLVQAPLDPSGRELLQDKSKVHVSQLSLVDLAGSERSLRTGNTGERMAESGHINGSLMTLRRCIEQLRENQSTDTTKLVPYRDSRLTHLFKNFFDGEGKVRMIVCVNPSAGDYEENLHVMQFAEMTQEVEVQRGHELDYAALFPALTPGRRRAAKYQAEVMAALESLPPVPSSSESPFDALPNLTIHSPSDATAIRRLRTYFTNRSTQRTEVTNAGLVNAEESWTALRQYVMNAEMNRRALEEVEAHMEEQDREMERINAENRLLNRQLRDLKARLAKNETDATLRYNNDKENKAEKRALEQRLRAREEKMKKLRDAVGGGAASVPVTPAKTAASRSVSRTRGQTLEDRRKRSDGSPASTNKVPLYSVSTAKASTMGAPSRPPRTPRTKYESSTPSSYTDTSSLYPRLPLTPTISNTDDRGRSRERRRGPSPPPKPGRLEAGSTPILDPKSRRRSKSLTIDHQPKVRVPGSAMDAVFSGSKTKRTTRPRSGDLAAATDYALTHQDLDARGNVRTSLYKGDVIGTAGGGSAVVFKDVEELSHRDPLRPLKRSSFEDKGSDRKRERKY